MIANSVPIESLLRSGLSPNLVQPRRSQIYVGFRCSQKCGFCYYKHKCIEKMFDVGFVKKQIDFKLRYGIHDFELTGGEPGEFQHLEEICQYIKEQSPASKIAVISNGSVFAKPRAFTLIDELLLSYHVQRDCAAMPMFPHGSTYAKAMKCVELARANGVLLRTNTVLGTFNLQQMCGIVNDLLEFSPSIINFLPINLFDQAEDLSSQINYLKLRPLLKHAIDHIRASLPDTLTYVRYMPFCDMTGYEQHLVGHVQHIYDWFDWNVELGGTEHLQSIQDNADKLLDDLGAYGSTSLKAALQSRSYLYKKPSKCLHCKHFLICDGLEKQLSEDAIERFAIPHTNGTLERNPLKYIGISSLQLYKRVYDDNACHGYATQALHHA